MLFYWTRKPEHNFRKIQRIWFSRDKRCSLDDDLLLFNDKQNIYLFLYIENIKKTYFNVFVT